MTQPPTGTLIGVGVGPGDPELLTIKAVKAIQTADVIAFHARPGGVSAAKTIATNYLSDNHELELLEYPVTTGIVDHPGGYAGAMADFYLEATTPACRPPGGRQNRGRPHPGRPHAVQLLPALAPGAGGTIPQHHHPRHSLHHRGR